MRPSYFLPIVVFAATVASFGSAKAQFLIEDDWAAPTVLAPPPPIVVPSAPVVTPGFVVVRRAPVVAAAPFAVAPPAAVWGPEPVYVAPRVCPYGYGYC
jgi:hypothetical protein